MNKSLNGTEQLAAVLAEMMAGKARVDWDHQDPEIAYDGKRIQLPNDPGKMGLREASKLLARKADAEETELQAIERIDAYPLDGAQAFVRAMKELYGWASPIPTQTFFGPMPPRLLTVQTGPDDEPDNQIQVPWGEFTIPGIENPIRIGSEKTSFGPIFVASGLIKKKEQWILKELANKAREILKTGSIYKAKAIRLRVEDNGILNPDVPPVYISTKYIRPEELILNPEEYAQVEDNLWAPVKHTDKCRKYGIPLKRGVLLEGPYGGGKTMTANVTSKICVDNGWTFILLDDVRALKDALLFAKRYAPAVVFAEDVDRIAHVRDQRGNDLLNTIDGILSKNSEVITVLTTNHVEKLERAMLRPGRLDAVVTVSPPGPEAVQRLIRLYARGLLKADEDISQVGEELKGQIPATIREVVERSKLGMIGHDDEIINCDDLMSAARSMKRHLELLNIQPVTITPAEALASSLRLVLSGTSVGDTNGGDSEELTETIRTLVDEISNNTLTQKSIFQEQSSQAAQGTKSLGKLLEEIKRGNKDILEYLQN